MAITFKSPDDISAEYLTQLKVLKPQVNTDQEDSDWWIRSKVVGGVLSGVYSDQRKVSEDAFPQSARHEGLDRHLKTYFDGTFLEATQAEGNVKVTGASGSSVPAATEFTYTPNGNKYQADSLTNFGAATAILVPVKSVGTGQKFNLFEGASLTLSSPPGGVDNTATVSGGPIANGKDAETDAEASARILNRIRAPNAGGTEADYKTFAKEADASVNDVGVVRYIFGPGTVGLYFTAGTSNVDQAIDNDESIVRIPSDSLVEKVAAYVDAKNPLTDCLHVFKPNEVEQDVTFTLKFAEGFSGSSVVSGQTKTLLELVEREIRRAVYKTPIGGRILGASGGFVLASEIEEAVDSKLSSEPFGVGSIAQVIIDRQCEKLSASGFNRGLLSNEIVKPGVLVIQEL